MQWLYWGGVRMEKARVRTVKEAVEAVNVALATVLARSTDEISARCLGMYLR